MSTDSVSTTSLGRRSLVNQAASFQQWLTTLDLELACIHLHWKAHVSAHKQLCKYAFLSQCLVAYKKHS